MQTPKPQGVQLQLSRVSKGCSLTIVHIRTYAYKWILTDMNISMYACRYVHLNEEP